MKYLQGVAFAILLMFAVMVDGIVEAIGLTGFAIVAVIVFAVTRVMIEVGSYD